MGRVGATALMSTVVTMLACESATHEKCQSVIDSFVSCGITVGYSDEYVDHVFADECEAATEKQGCTAELDAIVACQESGSCCDPEYFAWGDCVNAGNAGGSGQGGGS